MKADRMFQHEQVQVAQVAQFRSFDSYSRDQVL